jgi:hypothetical protein
MLQNQLRHSIRRLAMRKMPKTFEYHPSISSSEISVLPLRLTRQITKIRPSLNHQRRRRQRFHLSKSPLQIVIPSIPNLSRTPPRPIRIPRNRHPVRIAKTLRRLRKLCLRKPPIRAPRLPLYPCKPEWIFPHLLHTLIHTKKPLIPEPSRLLERRHLEQTTRLIRQRQPCNRRNPLRKKSRQRISHPRTPVMPYNSKPLNPKVIGKIDHVLRQRHSRPYTWGLLISKPCRPRSPQIRHNRPPPRLLKTPRHLSPSARRIRPPMQQKHRLSTLRPAILKPNLQHLRRDCLQSHLRRTRKRFCAHTY